ncbi:MAG: hypothetical protein Q9201_001686 [Fulgogasparrea decipioides]
MSIGTKELEAPAIQPVPYTTFTSSRKKLLTLILTATMFASPLTATIYLPLLPLLATHFHTSPQAINLTVTLYIVFQAISPLIFSTSSDTMGRRPILLTTYAIYTFASLGLALNKHSYAALLLLRALQSLGASAVLAVAYGVIADVCPPAERGAMQGFAIGGSNLATCLGPVVGGWVAFKSGGFTWVFWALVIFGGVVFLLIGTALPETARNVVGNGSAKVPKWRQTWWNIFKDRKSTSGKGDEENKDAGTGKKPLLSFKMTNPWACLRILFWRDTALVLWMSSSPYAVWYCVQTSIPSIYKVTYAFNELQIGLTYLPGAAGVILGSYLNGKLMDTNYSVTARSIGHKIDRVSGDNLDNFPIERARARGAYWLLVVYTCALAGYGWVVKSHVHESVPLVLQFVLGMLCTSFQQTFSTLLVDIFPSSPSAAAAAGNTVKCVLSAVAVAILQPLVEAVGIGWVYTMLTVLSGGGGFIVAWVMKAKGIEWRTARVKNTDKMPKDAIREEKGAS